MADTMPQEEFVKLGYAEKWLEHLWVSANNEAFLIRISQIKDIVKLDYTLREQIKSYARKNGEGNEQHKGDLYSTYISRKNWLSQTIFICRDEYKKTSNEVFNEVVKWCESWQNEWLEHYNPSKIEVMENDNPTTSATEENGKTDKKRSFKSLPIAIAVRMLNDKIGFSPQTISKTDSEGIKKFLKDIEEKFKIKNVPERVVRSYNPLKIDKDFFQNLDKKNKEKVKEILELGGYTELLKGIK